MIAKIQRLSGVYDGTVVSYLEMLVEGDKHTLSIRHYPKNTSVQMWENRDKNGTKVALKLPHNKFFFYVHISEMISNFNTALEEDKLSELEITWGKAVGSLNF